MMTLTELIGATWPPYMYFLFLQARWPDQAGEFSNGKKEKSKSTKTVQGPQSPSYNFWVKTYHKNSPYFERKIDPISLVKDKGQG